MITYFVAIVDFTFFSLPASTECGQHLKRDELCGQMFETESELACHVIWGIENRGEQAGHSVEFVNLRAPLQSAT